MSIPNSDTLRASLRWVIAVHMDENQGELVSSNVEKVITKSDWMCCYDPIFKNFVWGFI